MCFSSLKTPLLLLTGSHLISLNSFVFSFVPPYVYAQTSSELWIHSQVPSDSSTLTFNRHLKPDRLKAPRFSDLTSSSSYKLSHPSKYQTSQPQISVILGSIFFLMTHISALQEICWLYLQNMSMTPTTLCPPPLLVPRLL